MRGKDSRNRPAPFRREPPLWRKLDVLVALAVVAAESGLVRPQFNGEGKLFLRGAKHPVLDKAMRGGFVPNDVSPGQ